MLWIIIHSDMCPVNVSCCYRYCHFPWIEYPVASAGEPCPSEERTWQEVWVEERVPLAPTESCLIGIQSLKCVVFESSLSKQTCISCMLSKNFLPEDQVSLAQNLVIYQGWLCTHRMRALAGHLFLHCWASCCLVFSSSCGKKHNKIYHLKHFLVFDF